VIVGTRPFASYHLRPLYLDADTVQFCEAPFHVLPTAPDELGRRVLAVGQQLPDVHDPLRVHDLVDDRLAIVEGDGPGNEQVVTRFRLFVVDRRVIARDDVALLEFVDAIADRTGGDADPLADVGGRVVPGVLLER